MTQQSPTSGLPTRYYVNANGTYLGGFAGSEPSQEAIEVSQAPEHASQVWDGNCWSPPPVDPGISRRQRMAELLQIPRSDWTSVQMRELIELLAQDVTQ